MVFETSLLNRSSIPPKLYGVRNRRTSPLCDPTSRVNNSVYAENPDFIGIVLRARRESNSQPQDPQSCALSIKLRAQRQTLLTFKSILYHSALILQIIYMYFMYFLSFKNKQSGNTVI